MEREPTHTARGSECRLVCTGCGDIVRFDGQGLEPLRRDVERIGFVVDSQDFEVFGRCAMCRLLLQNSNDTAFRC